MNSLELVLIAALVAFAALAGFFAWKARKAGIPNSELLKQVQLQAGDLFDGFEERVVEAMRKYAAEHPATMKDRYFDVDDFLMDIGRLPATFTATIKLGEDIKRAGSIETLQYLKQVNGNVVRA